MPSVYALAMDTGEKRWVQPLEGSVFGKPALSGDTLWVADTHGPRGYLYALDVKDGRERARFQLSRGTRCSPVVVDGIVYVGDDGGEVIAVDTKTLQLRWQVPFRADGSIEAPVTPVPSEKLVFICSAQPEPMVYAVRIETGKEYWRHPMADVMMEAAPIVSGNNILVASGRLLVCMGMRKGQNRWTAPLRDSIIGTPALITGEDGTPRLYITCRDRSLVAVNATTGRYAWRDAIALDRAPRSTPLVTTNAVFVGSDGGYLYALDPNDSRLLWKYRAVPPKDITAQTASITVPATPAVANGRLVAVVNEGTVLCFGPDGVDTSAPEAREAKVTDITLQTRDMQGGSQRVSGDAPLQFDIVVADEGSGVNEFQTEVRLDGSVVRHRFDVRTGTVTYATPVTQPMRPLADGRHTLSVKLVDWKGNTIDREWVFEADHRIKKSGAAAPAAAGAVPGVW